jgi:predicted GIY-YIG superfamily endonuclease
MEYVIYDKLTEEHKNRSEASKREAEIKKWTRKQKLEFIKNNV